MNIRLSVLVVLVILSYLSIDLAYPLAGSYSSENRLPSLTASSPNAEKGSSGLILIRPYTKDWGVEGTPLLAKNGKGSPPGEGSREGTPKSIEEYEREKLNRLKRDVGRRLIAIGIDRHAEYYESPDRLEEKILPKEKEGFLILEVVQNTKETMYFYKIRFDSWKI
jgi:hypothetical protein